MKNIGILGGLGPESTIAYYSYITKMYYNIYRDYDYPNIIIYSANFDEFIEAEYDLPKRVAEIIHSLHKSGADFVVAACNSVHVVYESVVGNIPIPWISIMDAVGEDIQRADAKKVGLLGTVFTMTNNFYPNALKEYDIEILTPDQADQLVINEIIYKELVVNTVKSESREKILKIVDKLISNGAEGIILGCTELPFLINKSHCSCNLFDTTEIHAKKALDLALEQKICKKRQNT